MNHTIKTFVLALLSGAVAWPCWGAMTSPDGKVTVALSIADGRLVYSIKHGSTEVLRPSALGVTIDGVDFGRATVLGEPVATRIDDSYPWRGVKSTAVNRCNAYAIPVTSGATAWRLEVRVFDDGAAWRAIVPGEGGRTVTGEASSWLLPAGSKVWYHSRAGSYEGIHECRELDEIEERTILLMPVTVELPGGGLHLAITEAGEFTYSGMSLEKAAGGMLRGVFPHDPNGWRIEGEVCTPWRVTMVGGLDALVNCDIVHNLCPPPDKKLYPEGIRTPWIEPGRCLWQWWAYSDPGTQWQNQKRFVDMAAMLNCRYYLVDAGWENKDFGWMDNGRDSWAKLKELCDYAATRGVGIFVWRGRTDTPQGPGVGNENQQRDFFENLVKAGGRGVKVDYIGSESVGALEFYRDFALRAAEYQIMVNFHGANKPRGEARTWPNEMTREGVMGLEHNKWDTLPPHHYASLPFTRFLAGHGDFTPTTFQPNFLKGTTSAQQLASAVVFTSPILCWADKPEVYLASPVVDLIRGMPPVWDETRVLPGSKIGKLAAFARRSGSTWWVGILNGGDAAEYALDLPFLGKGRYLAELVRDDPADPAAMQVGSERVSASDSLQVAMRAGGGFTGRFAKLVMSPHGGAFIGGQQVVLTAADPAAEIRYTLDGSTPGARSPRYTGPVTLKESCVLTASIMRGDGRGTTLREPFRKMPPGPPAIDAAAADATGKRFTVTMTAEADRPVFFTTDGSEPDSSSSRYREPVTVTADTAVTAAVILDDGSRSEPAVERIFIMADEPPKPDVHLSDLEPLRLTSDWAEPGINRSIDGNPLRLNGRTYAKGLGLHANATAVYRCRPEYRRFVAIAGLDDEIKSSTEASVVFECYIDDQLVQKSPLLKSGALNFWHFDVPLPEGAKQIRLEAGTGDGSNKADHADWLDAGFIRARPASP